MLGVKSGFATDETKEFGCEQPRPTEQCDREGHLSDDQASLGVSRSLKACAACRRGSEHRPVLEAGESPYGQKSDEMPGHEREEQGNEHESRVQGQ